MELTQRQKRQATINAVLHTLFLAIVAYMTATGLMWRVPHYSQAILFFGAGATVAIWVRFWKEHH